MIWALLAGCGAEPTPPPHVETHVEHAEAVPCATGCAATTPDEHEFLGDTVIGEHLRELASAPLGAPILATETLLFHAAETQDYLARVGAEPLDDARRAWLEHELARDRVEIGIRLVDDAGTVLGWRDDVVPLVDKQHLLLRDMGPLGRAEIAGKIKRVGVKHLWARF